VNLAILCKVCRFFLTFHREFRIAPSTTAATAATLGPIRQSDRIDLSDLLALFFSRRIYSLSLSLFFTVSREKFWFVRRQDGEPELMEKGKVKEQPANPGSLCKVVVKRCVCVCVCVCVCGSKEILSANFAQPDSLPALIILLPPPAFFFIGADLLDLWVIQYLSDYL